ncbi:MULTISPECIES: hypothetical protein [unclassified Streptomyces]|uniref:hypothetical protein n=1 Tax=unclassified Streptomyces TaxID=2593676 RepID=UPI00168A9385|nr:MULTISPECIES: hypothetical protein [unclassified Streptomyces]MBD3007585.1 hypothetical protein [Streptomyces sp. 5-10]
MPPIDAEDTLDDEMCAPVVNEVVAIRLICQLACQLFRRLALPARSSAAKTSRS